MFRPVISIFLNRISIYIPETFFRERLISKRENTKMFIHRGPFTKFKLASQLHLEYIIIIQQ